MCEARGLTGKQGAIIPRSNVPNLMLDEAVLEAVRSGQFAIYAVAHVDEALSLLAGEPAGEMNADGCFAEGSINARVVARLAEIAERDREEEVEEEEAPVATKG